ncbi:MAG: RlmE family RNA methyltransferase [Alphaproteobacteria bacterium]|nr:RlmE family RNA methyltransferase [Alphaproteobacteria bacterium]
MITRTPTIKLRSKKSRKQSSRRWLERQLNDPYVFEAQKAGYRSRAAFKLAQLNDKYSFLKKNMYVIDLGAAPGGWSQVAAACGCHVVALDINGMDPLAGVQFIQIDFMNFDNWNPQDFNFPEKVDVVLSDMAYPTTGHAGTDHLRTMSLAEAAYDFARHVLKENGTFLAKVFQGGTEKELLSQLKKNFKTVKHVKPAASRQDSTEMYLLAQGFRG